MPIDPRIQALIDRPLKADCGRHRLASKSRGGKGKTVARGYAELPGTGPAGETCSSCKFKVSVIGGARSFPKCKLFEHGWTRGGASDIRVKSPACQLWEKRA